MDWIQQWQSKLNKQNGVAPLVRTGGSRHTGLAALPYRNIHDKNVNQVRNLVLKVSCLVFLWYVQQCTVLINRSCNFDISGSLV